MKKSIKGIVRTRKTWLQVSRKIYKIIVPIRAHFKCGGNAGNMQEKMFLISTRNSIFHVLVFHFRFTVALRLMNDHK